MFIDMGNAPGERVQHPVPVVSDPAFDFHGVERMDSPEIAVWEFEARQQFARELLSRLELPDCYFWAVHPLDSVKIEGWIGHDRDRMLDALAWSISHVDEHAINRTSRTGTL